MSHVLPLPDASGPRSALREEPAAPTRRFKLWMFIPLIVIGGILMATMEFFKPFSEQRFEGGSMHYSIGSKLDGLVLEPLKHGEPPWVGAEHPQKIIILNLFGPWYPDADAQLRLMDEIAEKYRPLGVEVLCVRCAQQEKGEDRNQLRVETEKFLEEVAKVDPFKLTVYYDEGSKLRDRLREAGAFNGSYPTVVLLKQDHSIAALWRGYHRVQTRKKIAEELERLFDPKAMIPR